MSISLVSSIDSTKLTLIEDTANIVSNAHEYILNKYDCTDFSRDLKNILIKSNIKAQCVFGTYRSDDTIYHFKLHTWVEVNDKDLGLFYIESTGGYIIPNEVFKEHYKIVTKGWCA
jgi:hypothetical protein